MKSEFQKDVMAGQAVYSKAMLATYDLFVLGLSNRFMWKCPTPRLLAHYNAHVSSSHLDLGVGTGFFLDRCAFPNNPRIVLVDLNPNCLEATARRISRYQPKTYRRNVLEPLELDEERFDSKDERLEKVTAKGTAKTSEADGAEARRSESTRVNPFRQCAGLKMTTPPRPCLTRESV